MTDDNSINRAYRTDSEEDMKAMGRAMFSHQQLSARCMKVVEDLARNYGVSNEKLAVLYKSAFYEIRDLLDSIDSGGEYLTESIASQIENIFYEVEDKRKAVPALKFMRNVDETMQANLQFQLYIQLPECNRYSINLKSKNCSHLESIEDGLEVELHMKPVVKRNKNNNPVGIQTITIPHVDDSKLDMLTGLHIVYGECKCIYKFDSGKQIKINASTRREALRVMNQILKSVRTEVLKGTAAKNCKFSENRKPHHLSGVRADLIWIEPSFISEHEFIVSEWGLRALYETADDKDRV